MKKQILSLAVLLALVAFISVSCQKTTEKDEDHNSEASAQSDDQAQFSGHIEAVANETNTIMELSGTMANRPEELPNSLCGMGVVIDSTSASRSIHITYNGADCSGFYTRTGTVHVSIPAGVHWKNAGATITVTYENLSIKRLIDNKSIVINGSHQITNVSGGLLFNLVALGSITHSITSDGMGVKFDDGTLRLWKVARQRVFTFNNGIVVTTTGTHTEGSTSGVAEWGTNRFGNTFASAITAPLVVRQDCSFRLVSGQIKHTVPLFTATATFGLNESGNPTSCPGAGRYYVKIVWTGLAGNPHTVILPY
jgi:hypothetical protein